MIISAVPLGESAAPHVENRLYLTRVMDEERNMKDRNGTFPAREAEAIPF